MDKQLFKNTTKGKTAPPTDTVNEAGGVAYSTTQEEELAQLVLTGTFRNTYYTNAEDQLRTVLDLANHCSPTFLAHLAAYARKNGYMKDSPAVLLGVLAKKDLNLFKLTFPHVIDNVKMLRNFVQFIRSGQGGRKSLGTAPKRLVANYINAQTSETLFRQSVGNDPSLGDVIKLSRPRPKNDETRALYGYFIGASETEIRFPEGKGKPEGWTDRTPVKFAALPAVVRTYEEYKKNPTDTPPAGVPMEMLTGLPLTPAAWQEVAKNASWTQLRMNLNTFERHGVFTNNELTKKLATKLSDPEQVAKAKCFPYQLMAAFRNATTIPTALSLALQDAMEHATKNVPEFSGKTYVFVDISGSMHSPVTGSKKGSTSKVLCNEAAALIAACVLRRNPDATIIPFHNDAITYFKLNSRDSVMTNAKAMADLPSGGTNCSAPLHYINTQRAKGDLIIYVSDNESWIDSNTALGSWGQSTHTMKEFNEFKVRNPKARMVCINLQPYGTVQAPNSPDIMNIGGFSDHVWEVIAAFSRGETGTHLVDVVKRYALA